MTVTYNCTLNFAECEMTAVDVDKLKAALDKEPYDYCIDDEGIEIFGEVDAIKYDTSAADVAKDIEWLLWKVAGIDADVNAREVIYDKYDLYDA